MSLSVVNVSFILLLGVFAQEVSERERSRRGEKAAEATRRRHEVNRLRREHEAKARDEQRKNKAIHDKRMALAFEVGSHSESA